jgi:hypothetical protein
VALVDQPVEVHDWDHTTSETETQFNCHEHKTQGSSHFLATFLSSLIINQPLIVINNQ